VTVIFGLDSYFRTFWITKLPVTWKQAVRFWCNFTW